MNKELKAKWVAALRSGEFKQTTGTHFKEEENAYCCLGVLCVVAEQPPLDRGEGNWDFTNKVMGDFLLTQSLYYKNDNGWTFTALADYIEANIPEDAQ